MQKHNNKCGRLGVLIILISILIFTACGALYIKEIYINIIAQNEFQIQEITTQISKNIGNEIKDNLDEYFNEKKYITNCDTDIYNQGIVRYLVDNTDRYFGYSNIPFTDDWYLVMSVSVDSVFLTDMNIVEKSIIILILIILAIIIVILKTKYVKKLKKAIFEDNLTKINNYYKFVIDAEKYLLKRDKEKCVVICFDILNFEFINDIYGYQVGDMMLKSISGNLKLNFEKRAIYGRISPDGFGLIIELEDRENDIENLISIIMNKIGDFASIDEVYLYKKVDFTIGIYKLTNYDYIVKRLIDNAKIAMTKAKGLSGKNYLIFDENMKSKRKNAIRIEQDLKWGLNENQFELYYQPKFDINTGKVIGSEALIRWNHPHIGFVSPIDFIHIAEKNGFINDIGKWVFKEVCKTINNWRNEGIDVLPVSINLSRVELYQEDLISFLNDTMDKYNILRSLIQIEITETTTINDIKFINKKIMQIKSMGIKIAMDDFGVGNSNFSHLKDIPIDILKIDRSFIIDIETNTKTKIVVKSVLELAKYLGLEIVCEGVENNKQLQILKEMGCSVVQGFVFSKAIRIDEFKKLLLNNKEQNVENL